MNQYIIHNQETLLKIISKEKSEITGELKVNFDTLNKVENEKYERIFNEYHDGCGCETGSLFCFASLLIYSAYAIINNFEFSWIIIRHGAIILFLSAGLGKIIGIIFSKIKLKNEVQNLLKQLDNQEYKKD